MQLLSIYNYPCTGKGYRKLTDSTLSYIYALIFLSDATDYDVSKNVSASYKFDTRVLN